MNFQHVTQIETKENIVPTAEDSAVESQDLVPEKKRLGIVWLGKLLVGSVFKGLTISIILGALSGLTIGIVGTVKGINLETLLVVGIAAGYVSGAIAMIAVIISGIRQTKRQKGELV